MPTEERQLAAIMFTDMVGYSAMAQRSHALELLEEHRGIVREVLARFHGTEIKTMILLLYCRPASSRKCVLGIPIVTRLPIPYSSFFSVRARTQ